MKGHKWDNKINKRKRRKESNGGTTTIGGNTERIPPKSLEFASYLALTVPD